MAEKTNSTFQVEEAFSEIEEIIGKLESDKVSLSDSIKLYAEGAKLIGKCEKELSGVKKKMIVIRDELDKNSESEE